MIYVSMYDFFFFFFLSNLIFSEVYSKLDVNIHHDGIPIK